MERGEGELREDSPNDVGQPRAEPPKGVGALLTRLDQHPLARFVKFGLVGGSGVFVNLGVFSLFHYLLLAAVADQWRFSLAVVAGIVVSIFTNFVMNDIWTWRDRPKRGLRHWFQRLSLYYLFASIAGLVQFVVASALHEWVWSLHELLSNSLGIGAGIVINFFFNNRWTFAKEKVGESGG